MPAALMLFAAGFGTRMRPLSEIRPKPLIDVAGQPLIQHALDQAADLPYLKIVANAHYLGDQIEAYFDGTDVVVNREDPEILDTGGGLRNALPLLGNGPLFTLNCDYVWKGPSPLTLLQDAWDPDRMDALLLGIDPSHALGTDSTGDFIVDEEGRATRGSGLIYAGAQITTTSELMEVPGPAFSMNAVWDRMIVRKRLFMLPYPGRWCVLDRPDAIPLAEAMLKNV